MYFRKFVKAWIVTMLIGIIGLVGIVVLVDPLNILNTPMIVGLNHYKDKEGNYLDLVKPYQVINYLPKVIFIGSSRVYVGWHPSLSGYKDNDVYNLGGSSLSLPDIESYLDYVYVVSKPEQVFLGLDFFQFGEGSIKKQRQGFSKELLADLSNENWIVRKWTAWCKSYEVRNTIWGIMKGSFRHRKDSPTFIRGWDVRRGSAERNIKEYTYVLQSYRKTYSQFRYDLKSMEYIERIVSKAKKLNVRLHIFFNPMERELYNLLCSYGHEEQFKKIKKQVWIIAGIVHELEHIEKYNTRKDLFYDASHYNAKLGEIMKAQILSN